MRTQRFVGIVTVLLLAAVGSVFSQTINAPPVHRVIFNNGLTLLVREDRSAPVVSAQAWVRAGSITEGRWMGAGLSHVLEHMLFKGTPTRGISGIAQEVENKGGYINAYTSYEKTVYHIDIPSENWATAVDILADCMQHASIPNEELLKEKQVILREMAMNIDDPARRADRLLWATAYAVHPYRHPVIGYPEIYNQLTRDDVVAYYKQMYVPNNITFVIVGDVKAAEVEAKLREWTKDFQMGPIDPAYIPQEPPQLALRERHEEMAVKLSRVSLAWHIPAISNPDVYALDVLGIILGEGRSSRLYRELREKRGLVHEINAGSYTPDQPGLFMVEAVTDADKREPATAAIREEINRIAAKGADEAELQKAIKISISNHIHQLKTMKGQATDLGQNQLLVNDPDFSTKYLANLRTVKRDDLQRVARKYFTDNNLTITSLDPKGALAKATAVAAAGEEIKIQKFDLPNGLRLLVREDLKLPVVDMRAMLKGGVIVEDQNNNGITKLTARMLLKGTKSRTADQIAERLESVGGAISYFSGNNSFGVATHVLSEDFERGLELLADVLENPTFPAAMLEREREAQLAEIKEDQDRIMHEAQQLLREAMFGKQPYRFNQLGTPASVAKLKRVDLVAFHRRFIAPDNMVLAVFGNVKADVVRRQVEAHFARMAAVKPEFPPLAAEHLAATVRKEVIEPKEQAVLLIGFSGADMFDKDRYALELIDTAYSGQGSRIFLRIRDELGLAYYVGAYQLLGLKSGYFAFYVGTTGPKVATCEKELFAELDKLKADGLTEEELTRAKNNLVGQHKVQMQDNAQLSMMSGLDELYGLGFDFYRTMDARYKAVTSEDVKRVAAKYFADKPYAVAIVKPGAKEK